MKRIRTDGGGGGGKQHGAGENLHSEVGLIERKAPQGMESLD